MNGTPMRRVARSVQLAVMAAPTTSVVEAAAEARRRHAPADGDIAEPAPSARALAVAA